jgi:hypothetical protein
MTLAADVTAKKGDTILQVLKSGNIWEVVVVSWGKKRATLIHKDLIGLPAEEWSKYHMYLQDGKLVHKYPIEHSTHYYQNI